MTYEIQLKPSKRGSYNFTIRDGKGTAIAQSSLRGGRSIRSREDCQLEAEAMVEAFAVGDYEYVDVS